MALKRVFDIGCSALGLALLSPVLVVLAAAIKLTSAGPIFYRGLRVGRHGKPFRIFKFRTMVTNAERLGGSSTSNCDSRITTVGRLLRKSKLDELPQLINVLRGDMSLVGPRPEVQEYVDMYTPEEQIILTLRPGITDWASVWNSDEGAVLAGSDDPDEAYLRLIRPTKLKLQLLYARNPGIWTDLKIIAYTLYCIVRKGWLPVELSDYPRLQPAVEADARHSQSTASTSDQPGYETVTELPGAAVNREQLEMLHTRYGWAHEFVEGKDVLEIACGPGIGLGYLAAMANKVVGGDLDPTLVEIGKRHYAGRIDVQKMDAQSLPFENNSFDVVIFFEAIYYLPDPHQFFEETRRVLRPDGMLLLCSANCERTDFNRSPFSVQYHSAAEMCDLLKSHGFQPQVYAAYPVESKGVTDGLRQTLRNIALRLHLIPKTMKWKARVKRLIFGKLKQLPAELGQSLPSFESPIPVEEGRSIPEYKVYYVAARKPAAKHNVAA